jgi:hypothetical protein
MDELLKCLERWLKIIKWVTMMVGNRRELAEKMSVILSFALMTTEIDGKISLNVFGGSAGYYSFEESPFFSSFPASDFPCKSQCAEEVA